MMNLCKRMETEGGTMTKLFLSLLLLLLGSVNGNVLINEISDKGTSTICNGEDWIELYNPTNSSINLSGYMIHDDNGPSDDRSYTFQENDSIDVGAYVVLCCNGDNTAMNPAFKIGGDDTVTLIDVNGTVIDTSGELPDVGEFDRTYVRSDDSSDEEGKLVQTTTPTPGEMNVITTVPTIIESDKDYEAQNALATSFFGMNNDGSKVLNNNDEFGDAIIDLHVTVNDEDWNTLKEHPYAETYIPVQQFKVVSSTTGSEYILPSPGRMRPRGQSTLYLPVCVGESAIPFKLDFTSQNATQTLFGIETAYLRNRLGDSSGMREWIMHRMLAKFNLPYLRTRHVKFHVNGVVLGYYTFMEAPDQDYVSARTHNWTFSKDSNALYKVKTMSLGCGDEGYGTNPGNPTKCTSPNGSGGTDCCADASWGEPKTCEDGYDVQPLKDFCMYTCVVSNTTEGSSAGGPYTYERGNHREKVDVKKGDFDQCLAGFYERIYEESLSVRKQFYDEGYKTSSQCGEFLVSNGIIDRDLGNDQWDAPMEQFINSHLSVDGYCKDTDCSSKKDIANQIDVENWLKNFAVYAVVIEQDSPMGNGNNYFLSTGGGADNTIDNPQWKIVPYDHNSDVYAAVTLCDMSCSWKDLTDWSIVRPTCRAISDNPLVGPLLTETEYHQKYLSYVREFVETVYTDQDLWNDVKEQHDALKASTQFSPDSDAYGPVDGTVLFEWMRLRSENVLKQLDLWDKEEYPDDASVQSDEACVVSGMDGGDGVKDSCAQMFCSNGIENGDYVIDQSSGLTCSTLNTYLYLMPSEGEECDGVMMLQFLCCPFSMSSSDEDTCATEFCVNGVENGNTVIDEESGLTCNILMGYMPLLASDSKECQDSIALQYVCCPDSSNTDSGGDTCGKDFCKYGVDNGDYVIDKESGLTCDSLKSYLYMLPADGQDCRESKPAEFLCCPNAKPECFLCGDKDIKMNNPNEKWMGQTCKDLDENDFQLTRKDACASYTEQGFGGFSIQSLCGCEGVETPKGCNNVCDDGQVVKKDGFIVQEDSNADPITCEEGFEYAKHATSPDVCEKYVETAANKKACCVEAPSGAVSNFSAMVFVVTTTIALLINGWV